MKSVAISNKYLLIIKSIFLCLSVVYLLQLFSPLRLTTDSVVLLSMAESFLNGHGFLYKGLPTHFPSGYPALLAFLDFIGFGFSWAFIAANLVFLSIGNGIVYYISITKMGFNKNYSYFIIIIILLSWVIIKHVTLPLSDVTFYGLSMLAIGVLSYAESTQSEKRWLFFFIGIFISLLAMTVRTVGIVIFIALIFQNLHKKIQSDKIITLNWLYNHLVYIIILSISFFIIIIAIIKSTYFSEALVSYNIKGGFLRGTLLLWISRLREMGELSINCSVTKIPKILMPAISLIGLGFLGMILFIIYYRRDNLILADYYILAYLLVIFLWPYHDPRFWLPIVPLLICLIAILVQKANISGIFKQVFIVYLLMFSLMGMAALAYSTRISLAGPRFSEYYGDNEGLRNVYRIFLSKNAYTKELAGDERLHLLRRFSNSTEKN